MKKKIIMRALLGAPIGLAISTIISIAISYALGGGSYRAIVPELAADCGSELSAVSDSSNAASSASRSVSPFSCKYKSVFAIVFRLKTVPQWM